VNPVIVFIAGLFFSVPNAYALEHMPTRHIEEQFTLPGDPRTFSRHIFIPVEDERFASPESRPLTYITEVGHWHVLMHLAYAIRWEDVPLPWEQRFLGDDDGILPKRIESSFKAGLGSHSFPKFQYYTELNSRHNQEVFCRCYAGRSSENA
jgi:hypothetical protein